MRCDYLIFSTNGVDLVDYYVTNIKPRCQLHATADIL